LIEGHLLVTGEVHLAPDSGVLDVSTRLRLKDGISVHSFEHRHDSLRHGILIGSGISEVATER